MLIFLILFSVFLNGTAQIFLRKGMLNADMSLGFFDICFNILTNFFVISGVLSYVLSLFIWLYIISKVEASYAYPFLSLGFVYVLIVGVFWMGESMSLYKGLGVALIAIGVLLIYKGG